MLPVYIYLYGEIIILWSDCESCRGAIASAPPIPPLVSLPCLGAHLDFIFTMSLRQC